jgi:hypothetical protein
MKLFEWRNAKVQQSIMYLETDPPIITPLFLEHSVLFPEREIIHTAPEYLG